MITQSYTYHTDPGHGWLQVSRHEIDRLGIAGEISRYSYECGPNVFLEEDCDAARFLAAKEKLGEPVTIQDRYSENTPIRNYRGFTQ